MEDLGQASVAQVLARSPHAAAVFLNRRMACVGCAMAAFDTVAEAARVYGVQPRQLAAELARAVADESTNQTTDR